MPHQHAIRVAVVSLALFAACQISPLPPNVTGPDAGPSGAGGTGGGDPVGPGSQEPCYCTRRPGRGTSFRCPMGVDEEVSAVIGSAGGTVSLTGQQGRGLPFSLRIPPTALAEPQKITITETSTPPPASFTDYSPVYRVEPVGLELAVPGELRVPWGNRDGSVARDLALYWSPSGEPSSYVRLADSYVNAGFNQASARNGGYLFVGAPKGSAYAHCP
jgi:hypothetical protein